MSRPLRIEYPGAWYHVMNRGRRGEQIFESKKDFETFVSLLREASDLWSVRVSAYCLIGNHYHLLLQTPKGNLSRFMRHLNGVYTQKYNSNEPINVAIYLCRLLRNDTMRELGNVFGMTGYSPASSAVERVKKRLPKNRNLENKIHQIIGSMRKKGQDET